MKHQLQLTDKQILRYGTLTAATSIFFNLPRKSGNLYVLSDEHYSCTKVDGSSRTLSAFTSQIEGLPFTDGIDQFIEDSKEDCIGMIPLTENIAFKLTEHEMRVIVEGVPYDGFTARLYGFNKEES